MNKILSSLPFKFAAGSFFYLRPFPKTSREVVKAKQRVFSELLIVQTEKETEIDLPDKETVHGQLGMHSYPH